LTGRGIGVGNVGAAGVGHEPTGGGRIVASKLNCPSGDMFT
jgi:hypothetical protein